MTNSVAIQRKTDVVSISLPPALFKLLEKGRSEFGQGRSAFIASLIRRYMEDRRWEKIYKRGQDTAAKFTITSEEDIDRILHEP